MEQKSKLPNQKDHISDEMWCSKCNYIGTDLFVYHSYDMFGHKTEKDIMCRSCYKKITDYEFKIYIDKLNLNLEAERAERERMYLAGELPF